MQNAMALNLLLHKAKSNFVKQSRFAHPRALTTLKVLSTCAHSPSATAWLRPMRSSWLSCDIINDQLPCRSLDSQCTLTAGSSSRESLAFPASGSGRARDGILMAALTSTLADEWGQQLPNGVVGVKVWVQSRPISGTMIFYLAQAYVEAGTRFTCLFWPWPSAAAGIYLCRLDIIKEVINPAATHPTEMVCTGGRFINESPPTMKANLVGSDKNIHYNNYSHNDEMTNI